MIWTPRMGPPALLSSSKPCFLHHIVRFPSQVLLCCHRETRRAENVDNIPEIAG
jgi:hypothetical protein